MRMRLLQYPERRLAHDALSCVQSFLFRASSALNKVIYQQTRRGGSIPERRRASVAESRASSMMARIREGATEIEPSGFAEVQCA